MRINRQDTNGVKPLLAVGELGYDNYPSGGDIGRVYVGTGSSNIAQAKKSEVVTVDGKVDTHVARIDNPHAVTKDQVGLGNVDNTSDVNKPISTSTQNVLDQKQNVLVSGTNIKTIEGQSIVGPGNIDLSKNDVGLSNVDNTADSAKVVASAGKWTTSRLINGTAVDGTIDITTSKWGTSRNITIGSTTKSVNGSADTSWSLAEIGAIGVASPAFTGVPTAPTAPVNDNSNQIATTAYVASQVANTAVNLTGNQTVEGIKTFTLSPIVPTPTAGTQAANKEYVDATAVPVGTIITVAKNTAPTGYLKANGALISRTTYSDLFTAIETTFGVGDGSTTFALPDLRGYFPRGWDDGRGVDTGREFGSNQADDFKSHNHTANGNSIFNSNNNIGCQVNGVYVGMNRITISSSGGTETRPRNIALLYCIKY